MATQAVHPSDIAPLTPTSSAASQQISTQEMIDDLVAMINEIVQALQKVQKANFNQQEKQGDIQTANCKLGDAAAKEKIHKIEEYRAALAEAKKWGILSKVFEAFVIVGAAVFTAFTFGAGAAVAVTAVAALMMTLESVPETQKGMDSISVGSGVTKEITGAIFKTGIATVLSMGAAGAVAGVDAGVASGVEAGADAGVANAAADAGAENGGSSAARAAEENAAKFRAARDTFVQRSTFVSTASTLNPLQNIANIGLYAAGKENDKDAQFYATLVASLITLLLSLYAMKGATSGAQGLAPKGGQALSDGAYQGLVWANRGVQAGTTATQMGLGYSTIQIGDASQSLSDLEGFMALCSGRQMMSEKTMGMLQSTLDNAFKQMGQILQNTQAYALMATAEADIMLGRKV